MDVDDAESLWLAVLFVRRPSAGTLDLHADTIAVDLKSSR